MHHIFERKEMNGGCAKRREKKDVNHVSFKQHFASCVRSYFRWSRKVGRLKAQTVRTRGEVERTETTRGSVKPQTCLYTNRMVQLSQQFDYFLAVCNIFSMFARAGCLPRVAWTGFRRSIPPACLKCLLARRFNKSTTVY